MAFTSSGSIGARAGAAAAADDGTVAARRPGRRVPPEAIATGAGRGIPSQLAAM